MLTASMILEGKEMLFNILLKLGLSSYPFSSISSSNKNAEKNCDEYHSVLFFLPQIMTASEKSPKSNIKVSILLFITKLTAAFINLNKNDQQTI